MDRNSNKHNRISINSRYTHLSLYLTFQDSNNWLYAFVIKDLNSIKEIYQNSQMNFLSNLEEKMKKSKILSLRSLQIGIPFVFFDYVLSVCYLPHKSAIYATILCLLGKDFEEVVIKIVKMVQNKFQHELNNGDRLVTRSVLSFFGELMNIGVIGEIKYLKIIYDLLNEAEHTLKESQDYYLYLVINTLTVVLPNLQKNSSMECKNALQTIQDLMNKRDKTHIFLQQPFTNKNLPTRLEYLLQGILQQSNQQNQKQLSFEKPYNSFKNELKDMQPFKLEFKLYFNNKNKKQCIYQSPLMMNLFPENVQQEFGLKEIPNKLAKFIIYQQFTDFIDLFHKNKEMVVKQFLHYDSNYDYYKTLVEAILGELLRLPVSSCIQIFYSSLLITISQEDSEIKDMVQEAFEILFQNVEYLDIECQERILNCLSHYISNLGYRFKWGTIEKQLQEVQEGSKYHKFVHSLIYKITRLLYWQDVEQILPKSLQLLLTKDILPELKYASKDAMNHGDYEILLDQFNCKITDELMLQFLQSEDNQLESSGQLLLQIFFECLFDKSRYNNIDFLINSKSKSLTHLDTFFKRYNETLKQVILQNKAVNNVWQKSEFHLHLHVEKLMREKLVTQDIILEWIFQILSQENVNSKIYWRLMFIIIEKVNARTNSIEKTYKESELNSMISQQLEKCYQTVKTEQKDMFLLIFKNISNLLDQDNPQLKKEVLGRLKQLRKYKNDFGAFISEINDIFGDQQEVQMIINQLQALVY